MARLHALSSRDFGSYVRVDDRRLVPELGGFGDDPLAQNPLTPGYAPSPTVPLVRSAALMRLLAAQTSGAVPLVPTTQTVLPPTVLAAALSKAQQAAQAQQAAADQANLVAQANANAQAFTQVQQSQMQVLQQQAQAQAACTQQGGVWDAVNGCVVPSADAVILAAQTACAQQGGTFNAATGLCAAGATSGGGAADPMAQVTSLLPSIPSWVLPVAGLSLGALLLFKLLKK